MTIKRNVFIFKMENDKTLGIPAENEEQAREIAAVSGHKIVELVHIDYLLEDGR